ncbi:MAG: DUF4270 domain-containing protein [Draconibacterium sp.]
MKSTYKNIKQFGVILVVLLGVFYGCNDYSNIGLEVLPAGDLLTIKNTLIKDDISSFTHSEDSIRTDEASHSLLGSFNDSLFGVTTIDFAAQFRLSGFPDFGEHNPQPDSISLYLYYRVIYGDTVTKQRLKVYELESAIDPDFDYKQDVDLKGLASDELLGQIEFTPKVKIDSASQDTFYQLIRVPLDFTLAEKLFNADSVDVVNNDVFLDFFKGLYIESEKISNQGGTILTLETQGSGNFSGSGVVLFYHNDSLKSAVDVNKDSVLLMPYEISQFSARINHIDHDYSSAPFYPNLNSETTQDSLIFVQANGGLKSKIFIDDLTSWKDSINTAINKAELIFQIDTVASQIHRFPPPDQLLFTVIDSTGKELLPIDYVFSPAFYGGGLREDYTYHFNITQHMQKIIEGEAGNFGFYLTPAYKNSVANRVVLKGSTSKTGIRLSVTYSKYTE